MKKLIALRNRKGFTLVELIVCLVILAILAAVAIPTMLGYVNKAKEAADSYECRCVLMASQTIVSQEIASEKLKVAAANTSAASYATDILALAESDGSITTLTVGTSTDDIVAQGTITYIVFVSGNGNTWYYYDGAWSKTAKA